LPEVNSLDAGYLLVTEEYEQHRLTIYRWDPRHGLAVQGRIFQGFPAGGPNFVFIDRVDDCYYLGIASSNWGWGKLFCARDSDLFPKCEQGSMNLSAFEPAAPESLFPFPVTGGASQNKLIRDAKGQWHLLGFRSDPADDPMARTTWTSTRWRFRRSAFRTGSSACTSHSGPVTQGSPARELTTWSSRAGFWFHPRTAGRRTRDPEILASSAA